MTNNSETPIDVVWTSSRTIFYPDDYTHSCHPLYVHPSDILGASLVFVPFDRFGYSSWRRTIILDLSIRNKLNFINGSSIKPHCMFILILEPLVVFAIPLFPSILGTNFNLELYLVC